MMLEENVILGNVILGGLFRIGTMDDIDLGLKLLRPSCAIG